MKDYNAFRAEDLIEDTAFQDWVYRGIGDPEWLEWLSQHPDRQIEVDQARNVLLSIRGELDELPPEEVKENVLEMLSSPRLNGRGEKPIGLEHVSKQLFWRRYRWIAAAAGFILVAGLGWQLFHKEKDFSTTDPYSMSPQSAEQYETVVNENETQKLLNLPDGSSVLLRKGSSLRFPRKFDTHERAVTLSGEAFFEIRKDPGLPFFVYANEMVTKVTGTSFNIRAYETDKEVRVRVKTGKVSVFAQKPAAIPGHSSEREGITLLPNQQAVLLRSALKIELVEIEQQAIAAIPIETENFEFRRTPVDEVFDTIEKTYNVTITYDAALLGKCTITALLGDEPLIEKLNMICEVLEATYKVSGDKIAIEAAGCG